MPGELQSVESQRVGYDSATEQQQRLVCHQSCGEGTDAQAQLPGFKSSSATSCRVTLGQLLDVSVLQLPTLQNEDENNKQLPCRTVVRFLLVTICAVTRTVIQYSKY